MSDYSWNSNPWVWALTFRRVNEPASGKPILFSGPMVRAILRGEKSQTRRVIDLSGQGYDSPQPAADATWARYINDLWEWWGPRAEDGRALLYQHGVICPYGKPGDRLYVRESWYCDHCAGPCYGNTATPDEARGPRSDAMPHGEYMYYAADGDIDDQMPERDGPVKWRPSIHMPKWASRITLEITEVRVQRLQEISEMDAIAEGFESAEDMDAEIEFAHTWDKINGKRGPKRVKVAA